MPALAAQQVDLFVRVADALVRLEGHERHGLALVVGEVDETVVAAQALFPRQDPALAQYAVDFGVAGIEVRPFDGRLL
jgi:hypothetical protein